MPFDSRQIKIVPTYKPLVSQVEILPQKQAEIDRIVRRIREDSDRYKWLSQLTGVPADFIAALHNLECGGSFEKHLANGDPISKPTVNVPAGIPAGTWEECAIAALSHKGWAGNADLDWDDKLLWLWRAEMWNGWGYRIYHPQVPTPYLWSGTSVAKPGKYVADGNWDDSAVSAQIGCVAVWLGLGIKFGDNAPAIEQTYTNVSDVANITPMELTLSQTPIGQLKISTKTWIKKSTASSSTLPASHKAERLPSEQPIPIFKRLADKDNHYQVVIKVNGELSPVFVYSLHAGIEMFADSVLDSLELETLPATIEKLPEKETVISIDPSNKKAIQEQLIRVGLLDGQKGAADGKWGSLSESAWRAWCRFAGLSDFAVTKEALDLLCERIGYKDLDLKPKDPKDKECVIATLCLKRMQELGMWLAVSMGSDSPAWNFFYLCGTNPDGTFNKDAIDYMNDLRFLAQIGSDGKVSLGGCWIATWDAGWRYRKRRMNSGGCFQISYDLQFWSWRPGMHGTAAPHRALVQQDPSVGGDVLIGTRDHNENGRDTADKQYTDGGAVNHHGTPGRSPGEPIGPYSAGCGVGDNLNSHLNDFMPKIDADRRAKASSGHLINSCFLDRSKVKGLPLA